MKQINDDGARRAGRSSSGFELEPPTKEERARLATRLSEEERRVLLKHGTERPSCGKLLHNEQRGLYLCRLCGLPLFRSDTKYDSRTGWPSFFEPFDRDHVRSVRDTSLGMERTEVRCGRCDAHLGHVFVDGPEPTGLRYCMNSAALEFVEAGEGVERALGDGGA